MERKLTKYFKATKADDSRINAIEVSLRYNKGGYNYFTYKQEKRGYYFSITPTEISDKYTGCRMITQTAFSGVKCLVEEIGRDSQKKFDEACEFYDNHKKEIFKKWFPNITTEWEEI